MTSRRQDNKAMKAMDGHLWQRFCSIATPYWRSEEKWKAWGLLLLSVLLLLVLEPQVVPVPLPVPKVPSLGLQPHMRISLELA